MIAGVNSSSYEQMYAASANSGSISFGQGQQYNPQESNIWAIDGDDYSVGELSGSSSSYKTNVNPSQPANSNYGLVDTLNQLDSRSITPTYQAGEHALDLYA